MAKKNKVEIDVVVDDKGSTKKVGLGAKKAAEGLDNVDKSSRNAQKGIKGSSTDCFCRRQKLRRHV